MKPMFLALVLAVVVTGCSPATQPKAFTLPPDPLPAPTVVAVHESAITAQGVIGIAWIGGALHFRQPVTLVERRCEDFNDDICIYLDGDLVVHLPRTQVIVYNRGSAKSPQGAGTQVDRPAPPATFNVPGTRA